MRPPLVALVLAILSYPAVAAPPTLEIPSEIKAPEGDWVKVTPVGTSKTVAYVGLDGLTPFPSDELKDPRKLILYAVRPGRYRFKAVGIAGDEYTIVSFTVVVGDVPPPSPIDPPAPPQPPADSLVTAIKNAAVKDALDKTRLVSFAKGFEEASGHCDTAETAETLNMFIGESLAKNFGLGAPKNVASVFKEQMAILNPILPANQPTKRLTASDRKLVKDVLLRLRNSCIKAAE